MGGTIGSAELKTVSLTAGTAINLGGNITMGNIAGGTVDIDGPAVLTAAVDIDANANNTTIGFTSTINNDDSGTARDLTLDTGAGAITVSGIIGGGTGIGIIDINKTDGTGAITLAGIGNSASSGTAGNTGIVDIGNTTTLDLNLAGYFFTGGTTNFKAEDDNGGSDENIDITANTTIKTAASNIVFGDAAIDIANGVTLLTINSGSGNVTLTDIHGDTTAATSDLDIDGATISVQNIGNSGARDEINAVNINGTTGVTLNLSLIHI